MASIKDTAKKVLSEIKNGRLRLMARQLLWVYGYAKKHWLAMLLYIGIGFVSTAFSLLSSFVSRDLTNMIIGRQADKIVQYFVMIIGYQMGQSVISQITNYISAKISMRVDAEVKADIFSKILVTDWESLTNYHTGDLLTRWGSDAGAISGGVLGFLPNLVISIARFVSAFVIVIVNDPSFAIFAFAGIPVSLITSRVLMRRMIRNNERSAAMGAKLNGFNQEAFSNIQTIKAFNLTRVYVTYLKELQKEYINMKLDFQKMSIWSSLLFTFVGLAVTYSTYGWGIYRMWSGHLDYGTMTMFLGLTATLTSTINSLTAIVPSTISLCTSAGRLMDIVEMPREDYSNEDEIKAFANKYASIGVSLSIEELEYKYAKGNEKIFEGANLVAKPHEVIALVGPSGEGKTTMLRIILSLMNSQSGEAALIAGDDISTTDPDKKRILSPSTRQLFSYVPQGNTMFSGTIAENMRKVKGDATDEEIIDALKAACAWEFVEKLPEQIYYTLGERGGGLSEGQAQRLSIARAIIRRSPILLLDEATSALDSETESMVLSNIMKDTYPRTCIVTTHRPSVLSSCNRVYAIENKKCRVLTDEEITELMTPKKRSLIEV